MEERTVNNVTKANKGFGLGKALGIGALLLAGAAAVVGIVNKTKASKAEAALEESYDYENDVTDVEYEDVETEE